MRIAAVKPNDLAVVKDDAFILIGDALAEQGLLPKGASMIDFITRYDSLKNSPGKRDRQRQKGLN